MGRYIAVIGIAVILAAALGSMTLFTGTTVINKKLTAAHVVKFLGYGAALTVLWLWGQRATIVLARQGGRWGVLEHLILPVVSLIVIASAHSVLLLVLRPIMDASLRNVYNWVFIAAIIGAAAWLVTALFNQSSSLTEAFTSSASKWLAPQKGQRCSKCGAVATGKASFCAECGTKLA
jgi:hypothetical protein